MPLGNFRQNILPYTMREQSDGSWLLLNREYQPCGTNKRAQHPINPHDYSIYTIRFKRMLNKTLLRLSWDNYIRISDDGLRAIFLYNDGTIPDHSPDKMKAYFEKLKILINLKCDSI